MKISNQKPVTISPVYSSAITGDPDIKTAIVKSITEPLFVPQIASSPVTFEHDGNSITADDLADLVIAACSDTADPEYTKLFHEVYKQTLLHYSSNVTLTPHELFANQAGTKEKMPLPTDKIIYTESDVITDAKSYLAGYSSHDKFFASLDFYARPRTLGFSFTNDIAFEDFKQWFNTQIQPFSGQFSADTVSMLADFMQLKLDGLTEALVLRKNDGDNNEPFSFARTLVAHLFLYKSQNITPDFDVLPFNLAEFYAPRTVVFVNIERHAKATAKQVKTEWSAINQGIRSPIKMLSNSKLSKLKACSQFAQQANRQAAKQQNDAVIRRTRAVSFRKTAPTITDIVKKVSDVSKKMANVNKSENTYKTMKSTYNKPNRRDPDDYNKPGKTVSTKYKPDIHIYLDTSGSISESNYEASIKALIKMAKVMNVNLYFNSFSHCMSQCTHLDVKDRSQKDIYKKFLSIPKVSGGTDFEQIWNYIECSPKRKRELSIIITDFGYIAPSYYVPHPRNLYYIPCANMNWNEVKSYLETFYKSAQHCDKSLRSKILV